jgi:hypothetical protein
MSNSHGPPDSRQGRPGGNGPTVDVADDLASVPQIDITPRQPTMSRSERADLARLARMRAKLARDQATARGAELLAVDEIRALTGDAS